MKRILALFLVFILIFSITACGMNTSEKPYDGETMSGTEENSNVSTEEMLSDVPDTYDYALQVSINPEFILYLVGSEVVAFGTEAVANELLKEAEDCGISVNPVITIEENLNFSENTMQENIENPEGEKPENHNPATSTAEDFQTSEGEPDESREPQWIEVECSICYGSGESTCKGCAGSGICGHCRGTNFTATGAGGIMVILHVMDVVEMEKKIVMVVVPQEKLDATDVVEAARRRSRSMLNDAVKIVHCSIRD